MRLGFAGTPPFAATILDALLHTDHEIELVLTQPGKPAGRGRKIRASPVEMLSRKVGVSVQTPTRLRNLSSLLEPLDALVVAAYGLILPRPILRAPRLGCINVHASLLPRWRGASPIEHAILQGDQHTGVSIMQLEAELDAGPIFSQANMSLSTQSTTSCVSDELAALGAKELIAVLDRLSDNPAIQPVPQQDADATYAPRLPNAAARIDWNQPALQVDRHIRAFHGRGMAFGALHVADSPPVRVRILSATITDGTGLPGDVIAVKDRPIVACGSGAVALDTIQMNVGKGTPIRGADAVNGFTKLWAVGSHFEVDSHA